MCVSMYPGSFEGTKIGFHIPDPALFGGVHRRVLLYQNSVRNGHVLPTGQRGANAMIIVVPTEVEMGPQNFVETTNFRDVLTDMIDAITPKSRGGVAFSMNAMPMRRVQVLHFNTYSVVVANDARDIPGALRLVDEKRRPVPNWEQFDWWGRTHSTGQHKIMLFCFNEVPEEEAEPVMFWFEAEGDDVHIPMLDAHDGGNPQNAMVTRNHRIALGSHRMQPGIGNRVNYQNWDNIPPQVRLMLPREVVGNVQYGPSPNGNARVSIKQIETGKVPQVLDMEGPPNGW